VNGQKVETMFSRDRMGKAPQWLIDEAGAALSRRVSVAQRLNGSRDGVGRPVGEKTARRSS
jgi:hypothetical protein